MHQTDTCSCQSMHFFLSESCSTSQRSNASFPGPQGKCFICWKKLKHMNHGLRWWHFEFWLLMMFVKVNALMYPNYQTCPLSCFLFPTFTECLCVCCFSTALSKMWFHPWRSTGCTSSSSIIIRYSSSITLGRMACTSNSWPPCSKTCFLP